MFCPTCVGFLHFLSLSLVCGTKSLLWYSCRHREWNRLPMEENGKKKSEDIEWHSIDFGQRSSINKISYWDSILHYHDLKCLKEAVIVPTHLLTLLKSKCRVHCTYGPVFGEDSCCRENHLPTAAPPPARPEASKVSAWGRPNDLNPWPVSPLTSVVVCVSVVVYCSYRVMFADRWVPIMFNCQPNRVRGHRQPGSLSFTCPAFRLDNVVETEIVWTFDAIQQNKNEITHHSLRCISINYCKHEV